jgi:hypothetical protein
MDRWAWEQIDPWLETRRELPIGALLCVIHGPTAGRRWEASAARKQLHHAAAEAGVRRRSAPHRIPRTSAKPQSTKSTAGSLGEPPISPAYPTRQPRDHEHLPPRHRQQRDHQHRPRPAIADDLGQRRSADQTVRHQASGRPAPADRPGQTPSGGESQGR